jgi:hypothetical protein
MIVPDQRPIKPFDYFYQNIQKINEIILKFFILTITKMN